MTSKHAGYRPERPVFRAVALLAVLSLLAACSSSNPDYDARRPHHTESGFRNPALDSARIGEGFWRWQWQRLTQGLPPQDASRVPSAPPDLAALRANRSDTTVTWLGHSTALWQLAGMNILTDPVFSDRASPVPFAGPKREQPPPIALAELPRIDLVIVSHNHYDHLDRATVIALAKQPGGPPAYVVPLGIDRWLKAEGIPAAAVTGLDWWDAHRVGPLTVTLLPVQHWSARGLFDRMEALWGGFAVQAPDGYAMFYAGDTGYSADFADIGKRFPGGFDFAQIPVGCHMPRWFMQNQHVDDDDALKIHADIKSRFSLGVHWGTFRLCDEPVEAPLDSFPPARARFGVAPDAFALPVLGATRVLRRAVR